MKTSYMLKSLIWLSILLFTTAGVAFGAPVGEVTYVKGKVNLLKSGMRSAKPVHIGDAVDAGDVLITKGNGRAEMTFANHDVLRMAASTKIEIKEYMDRADHASVMIRMQSGTVQAVSAPDGAKRPPASAGIGKFEVHTPTAVGGGRGSDMIITCQGGVTSVLFVAGKGYAYHQQTPNTVIPMTAGNIIAMKSKNKPPAVPRPASKVELAKQTMAVATGKKPDEPKPSKSFGVYVAKVTHIEGGADVLKSGSTSANPIRLGESLNVGDVIRTKSNGRVEITFVNKNILRVAASTRVEIKEHMTRADNSFSIVKMYRGAVQAISSSNFIKRVSMSPVDNKYEVHTPTAVCGIRGSDMIVSFQGGVTSVLFVTGKGYIFNPQMHHIVVPITAGHITFIEKIDKAPTPPRPASAVEITIQVKTVAPTLVSPTLITSPTLTTTPTLTTSPTLVSPTLVKETTLTTTPTLSTTPLTSTLLKESTLSTTPTLTTSPTLVSPTLVTSPTLTSPTLTSPTLTSPTIRR
jgi:hypothetical protein